MRFLPGSARGRISQDIEFKEDRGSHLSHTEQRAQGLGQFMAAAFASGMGGQKAAKARQDSTLCCAWRDRCRSAFSC